MKKVVNYQTLHRRRFQLWSKTSELRDSCHHRGCHFFKLWEQMKNSLNHFFLLCLSFFLNTQSFSRFMIWYYDVRSKQNLILATKVTCGFRMLILDGHRYVTPTWHYLIWFHFVGLDNVLAPRLFHIWPVHVSFLLELFVYFVAPYQS